MAQYFTFFDTAIGRMSISWTARGISGLHLPEENDEKTLNALKKRVAEMSEAPPCGFVQDAIKRIQLHLQGINQDFSDINLDLSKCSEFSRKVYAASRKIPAAALLSYGDIAREIGAPAASRAVGRALGANPVPIIIPCHRVIGKNGAMTGFSAYGGCNTKLRLLSIEQALSSDKISTSSSPIQDA
ncbi:MAG: methylated-DNA--[protein]-cysteine S-methyltransferase [Candidatus Obscuribacterales bacterium]|nr:methylated-DNA--[protein]-cysteine S-methyltransferase [Candidatus Obscuribacterales bacterium]